MTKEELEVHWLVHGRKEGRTYDNYRYIDGIDMIYWINLDRSVNRKGYMEKILSNIHLPNKRIAASDGKLDSNIMNNFKLNSINRSMGEYGCLLSHLRAIKTFWDSSFNRVLIFEDDISLDFSEYWNKNLNTVINDAPPDWEILMLSYTDYNIDEIKNNPLYRQWNDTIYSTVAYVINRKGANKIMKMYVDNKWNVNIEPHVADHVLYMTCKTYVYKYSYFTTNDMDGSNIHNDNLSQHLRAKNIALNIWTN
jgi:glycosyl transferase family 25